MEKPWLVYTAGPMGAGKSHTIRYLHKINAFPLDRFVWVDPDKIKSVLPDMPLYIHYNKKQAGVLTHRESGFIAEIIELEAMKQNKCVLVDGSLRNRDWYARWFGRIRAEFPHYRIAILLITATPERVYERAARRALVTAREIPKEVLDEAITQVPISFNALAPLADYSATLINDHDTEPPILQLPETIENFSLQWKDIYELPISTSSSSSNTNELLFRTESETYAAMHENIQKLFINQSTSSSSSVSSSSSPSLTKDNQHMEINNTISVTNIQKKINENIPETPKNNSNNTLSNVSTTEPVK